MIKEFLKWKKKFFENENKFFEKKLKNFLIKKIDKANILFIYQNFHMKIFIENYKKKNLLKKKLIGVFKIR